MNIEIVWKGQNALGEGAMWHSLENVLYWIDIAKPSLHRLNPVSGDLPVLGNAGFYWCSCAT